MGIMANHSWCMQLRCWTQARVMVTTKFCTSLRFLLFCCSETATERDIWKWPQPRSPVNYTGAPFLWTCGCEHVVRLPHVVEV
eukprot:780750-Pyramimonas_sp.AAC.1